MRFDVRTKLDENFISGAKWHENSLEAADVLTEIKITSKGMNGWKGAKKQEL